MVCSFKCWLFPGGTIGFFPQAHLSIHLYRFINPSPPRDRMVNYSDPATIAQDFGACAFRRASRACTGSPIYWSVFSTATLVKLWHVMDGIFMWGLPAFAVLLECLITTRHC